MFEKARLKLTGFYLLIIMLISVSFSIAIYNSLTLELNRVEQTQRARQERLMPFAFRDPLTRQRIIDPEVIEETKDRMKLILFFINSAIFGLSAVAGYFLAGRTLTPIKIMIDEQNRFIADASHELRTPLTSIRSEIEVYLRDKNFNLVEAKKLLISNLEEVNRLQDLSDNLIKFTQFQKPKIQNIETVNINDIVNNSVSRVSGMLKKKKIILNNEIKDFELEGDKQSLTELFVILLDNAIKYSNKETIISISNKFNENNLTVSVSDQGIGIPREEIPHVFDRFYRVDKSRSKLKTSGYGLGLSIAKQIVDKHSGHIKIESQEDKGTIVKVKLPYRQKNTPFNI